MGKSSATQTLLIDTIGPGTFRWLRGAAKCKKYLFVFDNDSISHQTSIANTWMRHMVRDLETCGL